MSDERVSIVVAFAAIGTAALIVLSLLPADSTREQARTNPHRNRRAASPESLPSEEGVRAKGSEWAAVATGCHTIPGTAPTWSRPKGGFVDYDAMPRWIGVILNGAVVGCAPRELLFPSLDNGAALNNLQQRSGQAALHPTRPPLPVFAKDGTLVAWIAGGSGQLREQAEDRGLIPQPLAANPPTAKHYEQNPR